MGGAGQLLDNTRKGLNSSFFFIIFSYEIHPRGFEGAAAALGAKPASQLGTKGNITDKSGPVHLSRSSPKFSASRPLAGTVARGRPHSGHHDWEL